MDKERPNVGCQETPLHPCLKTVILQLLLQSVLAEEFLSRDTLQKMTPGFTFLLTPLTADFQRALESFVSKIYQLHESPTQNQVFGGLPLIYLTQSIQCKHQKN